MVVGGGLSVDNWHHICNVSVRQRPSFTRIQTSAQLIYRCRNMTFSSHCFRFLPRSYLLLFCRATLCVSAVFAVVRCPSVTLTDCIHTAEDIVKLLIRPGRPITLAFWPPSAGAQFQVEPLQWGRKIHGVRKFCDFRLKSPFISISRNGTR